MENYVIESANKKQIMAWADQIWDAGIHDFEVLIFISTSAIYFYNKDILFKTYYYIINT